ncbi:hypothetical protein SAMN06298223_0379 [Olsenella sp. KH1P3]|uniref:Uncharacterized protein n=1 Tax=Parafannyhessea umbonata TaxID=604330 RepID=A0A1H6J9A7_9ACTN|nr:hypothetical protein SAMN05216447_105116 [Parafannyhessea umbonata]SJZ44656.1 hypothetical protein SAMN06298223_0379 [Olsenella sp. KH1P3]
MVSRIGRLYRRYRDAVEPKVLPEVTIERSDEVVADRRVLVIGSGNLAKCVAESVRYSGSRVDHFDLSLSSSGYSVTYDGAVIVSKLTSILERRNGDKHISSAATGELEKLYFANQFACKRLQRGCAIVNIVCSDSGCFWKEEIEGLTRGVAMAAADVGVSVNTIQLVSRTGEPDNSSTPVWDDLTSSVLFYLSKAGVMATGNVARHVVDDAS